MPARLVYCLLVACSKADAISSQITFSTHRYSIEALLELLRQEAPRSKMRYEQE